MFTSIIKRNGTKEPFNPNKIERAITKAFQSIYGEKDFTRNVKKITEDVLAKMELASFKSGIPSVEEIQEIVEIALMENREYKVAQSYIRYRHERELKRRENALLKDEFEIIDKYLSQEDWRVKENSNMGYSLQGLNNHIVAQVTSKYWANRVYNEKIRKAHNEGLIHIHDMGLLAPYCCGWDLEQLLLEGFTGVDTKVISKPAKHFDTALMQIVNFLFTLQGEAAGAMAFSSFDTYLAPFVYFDKLSLEEVEKHIEKFLFNLNMSTRVGFQSPFTNITLDVTVPPTLANKPVIIGGKHLAGYTYKDFQNEMDMINIAFCKAMLKGDGRGKLFSFPIPTYNITADFYWDSPVANAIMEMSMKFGIPYFANFINSDMKPEDATSMCCRLRLDRRELRKRGGGMFGANPMTGSIGVVTINLPIIGYEAKSKEEFKQILKERMDIAKEALDIKRDYIEMLTEKGLYPYTKHYLRIVKAGRGQYWANHFSTIGLVGMNEAIKNFTKGKEDITTPFGQAFAIEIMEFMRSVIQDYQEKSPKNIMYNLEATPAESTAYRLALLNKERYPDIITAGKEEPYYTNSTQLPVDFTTDIFEAVRLQENLQSKYTGGTVFHGLLGERLNDIRVQKKLVRSILENTRIPYLTISPTFSICETHGYLAGEQEHCPYCHEPATVYARIVGYYRPVKNWNKGKQEEYKERVEFVVKD